MHDSGAEPAPNSPNLPTPADLKADIILVDDLGSGNVVQETEIEGGHVPAGPPDFIEKKREKTRGELLSRLVYLLALLLLLHYVSVSIAVLSGRAEIKALETAFNSSLPVLAGLLGSAVAFYFKDNK